MKKIAVLHEGAEGSILCKYIETHFDVSTLPFQPGEGDLARDRRVEKIDFFLFITMYLEKNDYEVIREKSPHAKIVWLALDMHAKPPAEDVIHIKCEGPREWDIFTSTLGVHLSDFRKINPRTIN